MLSGSSSSLLSFFLLQVPFTIHTSNYAIVNKNGLGEKRHFSFLLSLTNFKHHLYHFHYHFVLSFVGFLIYNREQCCIIAHVFVSLYSFGERKRERKRKELLHSLITPFKPRAHRSLSPFLLSHLLLYFHKFS